MDNIFEQVCAYLSNTHLNEAIMNNEAYLQADAEIDKLHDRLSGMEISKEVKEAMDECINAYVNLMTINVELAYRQGMKDLADFARSLIEYKNDK